MTNIYYLKTSLLCHIINQHFCHTSSCFQELKKKIKNKTGHLVYLRNNSMWTTAGAIFSTTSAIKLYLCLRLFGCSWPEIETGDMSWVLQVTAGRSLQNTWIKKSFEWVSFPSLKVICSMTLGPRFPPCFSAQRWSALSLRKMIHETSWSVVHPTGPWGSVVSSHCGAQGWGTAGAQGLFPVCAAHSPFVKGILYSDASTAALLFWMVYLACMVFSD